MRRGRIARGLTAVALVAALGAPGASAASPQKIYRDMADNGRLDGTYSRAELKAFAKNAYAQAYPNAPVTPVAGVAGQTSPVVRTARKSPPALRTTRQPRGTLPFTGLDLALMTAGGLFLLGVGGTLRRVARAKAPAK
jgi:hypothetical protein